MEVKRFGERRKINHKPYNYYARGIKCDILEKPITFSVQTFACVHAPIKISNGQAQSIATVPASEVTDLLILEHSVQNKGSNGFYMTELCVNPFSERRETVLNTTTFANECLG